MIKIRKRSKSTAAGANRGLSFLTRNNYVLVGLTDNVFEGSDGVLVYSYQAVLAQLDNNNQVVRLVPTPFASLSTRRSSFLEVGTNEDRNNDGNFVATVDGIVAQHLDLAIETIWHEHIVPMARQRVLAVVPNKFRTRSANGREYTQAVYTINDSGAFAYTTAVEQTVEALARASHFAVYTPDRVLNEADQKLSPEEEAEASGTPQAAAPAASNNPFANA